MMDRFSGDIVFRPNGPIDRPRLTRLAALLATRRLVLVHAPAGCGKTTLLSQWRAALLRSGVRVAWLSIGDDEQDPVSLAAHLIPGIRAVCGLEPTVRAIYAGEEAIDALQEAIDAACLAGPLAVMIDDYHLAQQPGGRQTLAALIACRHPGLVVVIAGRGRPDLALGRLRANDELIEIDVDALRFSADEMEGFFDRSGGAPLTTAQSRFVQQRTEGWAAGLRLMSLALNRSAERDAILAGTPGSQRDFAEYFLQEVLEGLDARLIRFLSMVSILDLLQAELCQAVTGDQDASRLLDDLERGNLFTTALPGRQGWYRFHHLFLEFLRARLPARPELDADDLHRRAADWFVAAGHPIEAVRHAFLSRNPEWAAELIERYCVFDYLSFGRFDLYHRWMCQLPGAVLASRPLLSFLLTWRYINGRRFAQAEQVLSGIEVAREEWAAGATVPLPTEIGLRVEGRLHLMRALIGAYGADFRACRRHIDAIGAVPLDELAFGQVDCDSIHSYLSLHLGDLDTAQRLTWKAFRRYEELDCHWGAMHSQCIAAMASMAAGHMQDGRAYLIKAIEAGRAISSDNAYPVALPCGLLGALLYDIGLFDEAEPLLLQATVGDLHSNTFGLAERVITPTIALARLYDATGRAEESDALLARASRLAFQTEDVRLDFQLAVERADRAFRLQRIGDAATELTRVQSKVDVMQSRFQSDMWAIWQPYGVLDARRMAHFGQESAAVSRLQTLAAAATRQQRYAHALSLDALAASLMARSAPLNASGLLETTRDAAARMGLVRILPDTGLPAVEGTVSNVRNVRTTGLASHLTSVHARYGLTRREQSVLACLGEGLNNAEIARRLAINLNTVKSHLKSVFHKLDVSSRSQALLISQDLRSAPPSSRVPNSASENVRG